MKSIMKSLTSSLPLLVIGLGRLVSVKGIDYHEHVSEYGLHWNFFFTLAATKVMFLKHVLLFFYLTRDAKCFLWNKIGKQ